MLKNGGVFNFYFLSTISFFYTIFCVHALDFATRYGIIVKHELMNTQYIVLKKEF